MKYNGYTNWQTWTVKSHLDNTLSYLADVQDIAGRAKDTKHLAKGIEHLVYDIVEGSTLQEGQDSKYLLNDLLEYALEDVNWLEIAKAYKED